jgi:hypothetical protein
MSCERNLRYTLSAVAWIGAFLCALGLLSSAAAVVAQSENINHSANESSLR